MKIVKYIFLLLLLIGIALVVFVATQEGRYDIKQERVIKVPKTTLYNYINDYRNWENVSILTDNDTTAVFKYNDVTSGQGSSASWKVDDSEGELKTIKTVENDSLIQNAVIDGQHSDIAWAFKDTLGGTKVTVRIKGELSFADKAYAVLRGGVQEKLETSLDTGLKNLDSFIVNELGNFKVDVNEALVSKTGTFYIGRTGSKKISEGNNKMHELLLQVMAFAKENNITTNGSPFIIYKSYDTAVDKISFTVCVPIKEEIFTTPGSEIEGARLAGFTALKTTLKGDYSHLNRAWDAARKHISAKGLQENTTGTRIEVYTRNIQHTKKPSGWVTDIYIPIGAPTVLAAEAVVPTPPVSGSGTATAPSSARPANIQPRPATTGTGTRAATTPANRSAGNTTTPARTAPVQGQPARTTPTPVQQ